MKNKLINEGSVLTRDNKLFYLASPYTHNDIGVRHQRAESAKEASALLFDAGQDNYSPIAHLHDMAIKYQMPEDSEYYRAFNFNILRRCDELLVLTIDGWDVSDGVDDEINLAKTLNMNIRLFNPFDANRAVIT